MKYSYTGSTAARTAWGLLIFGTVVGMGTSLALGLSGLRPPGLGVPTTLLEQVAYVVGLLAIVALFGTPFITPHELRRDHLWVRLGVALRAGIPYDDIASVERTEQTPLGLGVRWYPDVVFAITWPSNLVAIHLRRPRRFRLLGLVPLPSVPTLVINADRPDELARAIRARIRAGVDEPTEPCEASRDHQGR